MAAKVRKSDNFVAAVNFLDRNKQIHVIAALRLYPELELHISCQLGFLLEFEFKPGILSFIIYVIHVILNPGFFFKERLVQPSITGVQEQPGILCACRGPFVFTPGIAQKKLFSDLQLNPGPVFYFAV